MENVNYVKAGMFRICGEAYKLGSTCVPVMHRMVRQTLSQSSQHRYRHHYFKFLQGFRKDEVTHLEYLFSLTNNDMLLDPKIMDLNGSE